MTLLFVWIAIPIVLLPMWIYLGRVARREQRLVEIDRERIRLKYFRMIETILISKLTIVRIVDLAKEERRLELFSQDGGCRAIRVPAGIDLADFVNSIPAQIVRTSDGAQ